MIERDDGLLAAWLAEGPVRGPDAGLARVLETTGRIRQRPAWMFGRRWLPLDGELAGAVPGGVRVLLVVVALVLLAAVAALLIGGSQRHLPPPFGPASNGLIAYHANGVIYIADPGGADPRRLDIGQGINGTMTFSHDGTRFAFWSRRSEDGPLALYVARADDGSGARRISGDLAIDVTDLANVSWSPDDTRIAFHSMENDVARIYVVPADGSAPPVAVTDRSASRSFPDWSEDGLWLAFQADTPGNPGSLSVGLVHPDGSGLQTLYAQMHGGPDEFLGGPSWAPGGRSLVYARSADPMKQGPDRPPGAPLDGIDGGAYLVVLPIGGTEHIIYRESSGQISWPSYSPDGTRIVFATGESAGQVHLIRPDGSGAETFLPNGPSRGSFECSAGWSPDGALIVVNCRDTGIVELIDAGSHVVERTLQGVSSFEWQRTAP